MEDTIGDQDILRVLFDDVVVVQSQAQANTDHHEKPTKFLDLVDKYITRSETGQVNVSRVFSRQCFEEWMGLFCLKGRRNPEERFRKNIIIHVTRSDGKSTPFHPDVESAILKCIRRKHVWPCFQGFMYVNNPNKEVKIGIRGARVIGFHENLNKRPRIVEEDPNIKLTLQEAIHRDYTWAINNFNHIINACVYKRQRVENEPGSTDCQQCCIRLVV